MTTVTTKYNAAKNRLEINGARLAFADRIFEPKAFQGTGKPTYGGTLLVPNGSPAIEVIETEELRIAKEKWGAKAEGILAEVRANNRQALKPGELKASYAGFPGQKFISCTNDCRPTVVDVNGAPLTAADGRIYAGCYVLAHVTFWAQDNNYGRQINANLTGLQFLRDGDAFAGGPSPSSTDDFADLSAGEGLMS